MEELERMTPGTIDNVGQIVITEKESITPHFDIIKSDGTKISIMIQENKYMPGERNSLTPDECKKLNEWAHSNRKKEWWNHGEPNWDVMTLCWNGLYNDYEIEYDQTGESIPDYTTIYH